MKDDNKVNFMKRTEMKAEEILALLDQEAKDYNFPMPDNLSIYNAGMRLTAFRSDLEWLILFEMINYTKNHEFINEICAYGNQLNQQGFAYESPIIMKPLESTSFYDATGKFSVSPWEAKILLKNEPKAFRFQEHDYVMAGIHLENQVPIAAALLRLMVHKIGKNIYEKNDYLLELVYRKNQGLKQFIKLDQWNHPDLANDEMPSDSISMSSLAKALEENDKKLYFCPESYWNSDWKCYGQEYNGWE